MQHDIFMSPSILHFHGFILARQSSVERHELIHTNVELFSYFKLIRFWEGGGRLAHRKRYSKATISSGVTLINHAHISMRMENSYNDNLSDIYSGFLSSISNSWLNFLFVQVRLGMLVFTPSLPLSSSPTMFLFSVHIFKGVNILRYSARKERFMMPYMMGLSAVLAQPRQV